jgi:hypothetical protein
MLMIYLLLALPSRTCSVKILIGGGESWRAIDDEMHWRDLQL